MILERLRNGGLSNLYMLVDDKFVIDDGYINLVRMPKQELLPGDVVAITPGHSKLQVLYRESDIHHTVFLTNRCNSLCLMCSQPPTAKDDSWLIEEAIQIADHIRHTPRVLGFTGGEPLLLGDDLRRILEIFLDKHPGTRFEVLTNGRAFSDHTIASSLLEGLASTVTWLIPLYGHADFLHDYIVQANGAFEETIDGLLTLHMYKQNIQLRIVLIEPVLQYLPELCKFIARNLPFVREVALMGCEPTGYALRNRAICEVDYADWGGTITQAINCLMRANIPPLLMNIPLCALPMNLQKFAHRSISDWKQQYAPECSECHIRKDCCGFFASADHGWKPSPIRPIADSA